MLSSFLLWPAPVASAFSGSGNGTSGSPYQITSCAEWQEINDEPSAHYALMNDIDCSADGGAITIGNQIVAFSGVLEGNNNQITVNIDDDAFQYDVAGLFNYLGGTVQNLEIAGTIKTQSTTGALTGYAEYSVINNVHVTADVQGGITGGRVGQAGGSVAIEGSAVTGNVSGSGYTGGIVGHATSTTIEDTTYQGEVTGVNGVGGIFGSGEGISMLRTAADAVVTGTNLAGGLAGVVTSTSYIRESYATGSATVDDAVAGGLVGSLGNNGHIENSYSRSDVTANDSAGGIVGSSQMSVILVKVYASGQVNSVINEGGLVGLGMDGCAVEDSFWDERGGANPTTSQCQALGATSSQQSSTMKDYFLYIEHTDRWDRWNFDTVWGINPVENDGYPFLQWQGLLSDYARDRDPVDDAVEDAAPNNGDADDNGIRDADESDVASLPSATDPDRYITVRAYKCVLTDVTALQESDLETQDAEYDYPTGFVDFTADCGKPGISVTIIVLFHGLGEEVWSVRKYDPTTQAFGDPNGFVMNYEVGSERAHMAVYEITDGGPLDADGLENGILVDPIGLALVLGTDTDPNTDDPGEDAGDDSPDLAETGAEAVLYIFAGLSLMTLASGLVLARRQPKR